MTQPHHLTAHEQAKVTFDTLDAISRERALTLAESMTPDLAPILSYIDLSLGLDLALNVRRAGRPRRQEISRRGWVTRRDSGSRPQGENSRSEVEREARQNGPQGIAR